MSISTSFTPACDPADAPGGVLVLDNTLGCDAAASEARNASRQRVRSRTAADVDLDAFAGTVLELADSIEPDTDAEGRARGRFGPHKVFIAAIRRALRRSEYRDLAASVVDELLVRAHRARALQLARADLVAAMDPEEVRESEVVADPSINVTFHFVVAPRSRNVARIAASPPIQIAWIGDDDEALHDTSLVHSHVVEGPTTWTKTFLELRHHAEAMRGFLELNSGTSIVERWPRTTGADVIAIAALIDPHVRALHADDALALRRRWSTCIATIGRRAVGALATTYPENRALWSCLAAVFVHLASIDAPLPDPATWRVLVCELGHVLARRNARMTEGGVVQRVAGPVGDAPFKPAFDARTFHELYLEQFKYLRDTRGADRMKPPPGGPGSEQPIPRTTNADVILLADYWSKQLAKVQQVYGHDAIVARWKTALADIDRLARTGAPTAAYANNNVFWRELSAVARQVSVADEAPTKWDYLYESFKENLAKLPGRIVEGAKTVGTAASDMASNIAHGIGKVANEAGKGLFSGFGTPLLIGAGVLGVFLISRARREDKEA